MGRKYCLYDSVFYVCHFSLISYLDRNMMDSVDKYRGVVFKIAFI